MSAINSFSFRNSARALTHRPLDEHEWAYDSKLLTHMFGKPEIFVEMGGLLGLSYALRSDTTSGISSDEAESNYEQRKEIYGTNHLPLPPVHSLWEHACEALADPMLIILIIAGGVSIAANTARHPEDGWIEGLAILIAVVLVVGVTSINNYSQEIAFMKLAASLKGSKVTILRHGVQQAFDQDDILVGDVVSLNPGAMIPADGILIDQTTLHVNESALTGEPDECVKNQAYPFLAAGTEVVDGCGQMLVTAVGLNSAKGKLMSQLAQQQELTNLQIRLEETATFVGYIGLGCAILTFLSLIIRWIIFCETDSDYSYSDDWDDIIEFFIISVTIIVVAIPEGLPLAVTVSLAYSMSKMRDDQNLVKVLSACETMGNATAICSDKTGTLTQNKMKVVQLYTGGVFFPRQAKIDELDENIHKLLIDGVVCNSDRRVAAENMNFDIPAEDWKWEGDGGATEAALLSWISNYHLPSDGKKNIMELRVQERERTMQFYPFSSAKKVSSVIMQMSDDLNDCRRYYKGAADRVIKSCTSMINHKGEKVQIGSFELPKCTVEGCKREAMRGSSATQLTHCDQHSTASEYAFDGVCRHNVSGENCNKYAVMGETDGQALYCTDESHHPEGSNLVLLDQHPYKLMSNMTRVGLRCIAFAYVDGIKVDIKDGQFVDPPEVGEWTLVGLVGIKDPLRVETRDAVMTVQQAGIIVRMVTGDNIDTARFIAQDCGIITHPRHIAIEGSDFRMALEAQEAYKAKNGEDNPDFVELIKNLRVMARCQPEDKLELVKFLKDHGDVVGVTGDGSNDGPALKAAHVGLAMGIAGTDVAKAAADIIILDDNFSSIVRSVMWGRCVFDNIRKFLQFQCSVNLCALGIALIGAISDGKEPLKPVQLLWVNLIMDTMGALALGTENPKPTLLQRKAYRPDGPLISKVMWRNIIGQGLIQLAILLIIMYDGKYWLNDRFYYWGEKLVDVAGTLTPVPWKFYDEEKHFTLLFNTFVWFQFFNEINSRKVNPFEYNYVEGFFSNYIFTLILAVTALFQYFMVELFGSFASTVHQEWDLWLIAIALGLTQLVSGSLLRFYNPDPEEGQIVNPPETFENAAWINNPKLLGALFNNYNVKQDKDGSTVKTTEEETNDVVVETKFAPADINAPLKIQVY